MVDNLCRRSAKLVKNVWVRIRWVVNWNNFEPSDFEYDFENDELAAHRITFEEATSVFEQPFGVRRNKGYRDRYQILGVTDAGRRLKLIVQVKPGSVVRIITGWDR